MSQSAATIEFSFGTLTLLATLISSSFLLDLVGGLVVYTSSRLFYFYFGTKIQLLIRRITVKSKLLFKYVKLKLKR